jgi:fumarate reductase subunit D
LSAFDFGWIDGDFFSTPLPLTAALASALSALVLVFILLALRRSGTWDARLLPVLAVMIAVLMLVAVLDRSAQGQLAAERRALISRDTALTALALAPGSALGCLNAIIDEQVSASCEETIFATPQSTANAISYVVARLKLLNNVLDLSRKSDRGFANGFSDLRRSIELDRFGIVAHVLATRDHCTAEDCPFLAQLKDNTVLKTDLIKSVFDEYIARYAAAWDKKNANEVPLAFMPPTYPPQSSAAPTNPVSTAAKTTHRKNYFPSAASIPPVSIMNAEQTPKERQSQQ